MQHEIWVGKEYQFTCGWDEDPWVWVDLIEGARVVQIADGIRRDL